VRGTGRKLFAKGEEFRPVPRTLVMSKSLPKTEIHPYYHRE
jgi:hypothetical protein